MFIQQIAWSRVRSQINVLFLVQEKISALQDRRAICATWRRFQVITGYKRALIGHNKS